jgi:hypothetical protein
MVTPGAGERADAEEVLAMRVATWDRVMRSTRHSYTQYDSDVEAFIEGACRVGSSGGCGRVRGACRRRGAQQERALSRDAALYRVYRETGTFESLQRYGAARARRLGIRDEGDVERLIAEVRRR